MTTSVIAWEQIHQKWYC